MQTGNRTSDATGRHESSRGSGALRLVGAVAERQRGALPEDDTRQRVARHRDQRAEHRAWEVAAENQAAAAMPATDARWVMAVRVSEALEGGRAAVLRPRARSNLLTTARVLGLRPFDANLVIAIVQDAARRGESPLGFETADRLAMVAPPPPASAGRAGWLLAALVLGVAWAGVLVAWLSGWL